MAFDIIPFIIIIVSLLIIFFIVLRKFPLLSQIDIEKLPAEKQSKVREKIVLGRIERRLAALRAGKIGQILNSMASLFKSGSRSGFDYLVSLEEKFKKKEKVVIDKDNSGQKVSQLLIEADELFKMHQLEEAEKKYIEAISLDKKNKEAYQALAEIYFERKEFEQAKEIYKHLLKLNSQDDAVYAKLGRLYLVQGNFLEAEKDYLKSLKIQERCSTYIDLGLCYKSMECYIEAQETLKKALELEPNNPRLLDLLLEISIIVKDKNLANYYWQRLAEVDPENQKLDSLKEVVDKL